MVGVDVTFEADDVNTDQAINGPADHRQNQSVFSLQEGCTSHQHRGDVSSGGQCAGSSRWIATVARCVTDNLDERRPSQSERIYVGKQRVERQQSDHRTSSSRRRSRHCNQVVTITSCWLVEMTFCLLFSTTNLRTFGATSSCNWRTTTTTEPSTFTSFKRELSNAKTSLGCVTPSLSATCFPAACKQTLHVTATWTFLADVTCVL